jgi:hypothetical protein
MSWDQNIAGLNSEIVEELPPSAAFPHGNPRFLIFRSATKAVGPISGRDFVDCVYLGPLGALPESVRSAAPAGLEQVIINGGSGLPNGHASFTETSAFVRGFNHPGCGWVLQPLSGPSDASSTAAVPSNSDGWTRVYYVVQSELKGWLPTAVVNSSMVGMFTTFFTNFLAHMAKKDLKSLKA